MRILPDADLLAVELDDEHALRGADVKDDAATGSSHEEGPRSRARRRRSGRVGIPGGRGTASGRSCSAAGPRCRPSSRGPARPLLTNRHRASSGERRSWKRQRPSSGMCSRGRRCASAVGRSPSPRGDPRSGHETIGQLRQTGQRDHARPRDAPRQPGSSLRRLWAIRGVDLEVSRGELGLLGPNGAGNTTVRLLTALIEPTEGRAWVDGLDVTERPEEVRGRVGFLTETPGLYEKLSATPTSTSSGGLQARYAARPRRADRALPAPLLAVGLAATTWTATSARA